MTVIINLWAGPSCRKSTQAAKLFAEMKALEKERNFTVEIVTEFAKELAWMKVPITEKMQNYIFFEQLKREMILVNAVDFIITDSPTGIGSFYAKHYNQNYLSILKWEQHKRNENYCLDFWCPRLTPYNPNGRNETEEQALLVDQSMKTFVSDNFRINEELKTKEYHLEILDYLQIWDFIRKAK